jgi:transaldolase/glucose-6-phosphate isomerase
MYHSKLSKPRLKRPNSLADGQFVISDLKRKEQTMNPLQKLHSYGQSFWYDNIRRSLLQNGTISSMIENDGLRGMTSNPSIFEKAIGKSVEYDTQISELAAKGLGAGQVYEGLAVSDIVAACDLFEGVHRESDGHDGFVSLEVSPHLANDEEGTVFEARRLSAAVNRPNLMIKVPATDAGVNAMRRLIADGININVTLMFSMGHYEAVAAAYIAGLSSYSDSGGDPSRVASVASFFVSRVDTAVDRQLSQIEDSRAASLKGQTAISNSKLVYQRYKELFLGEAFETLRRDGARVQRLLWASTSTKNPDYPDTLYVDELIGRDTVNTMPPNTIDAFRDHGQPKPTLEQGLDHARQVVYEVRELGIELDEVTNQLQQDGVVAFSDSYDQLLKTIEVKLSALTAA